MHRVCIVIVYFGNWPAWFSAWLRSCSTNQVCRWLIFTDLSAPPEVPTNVQISYITVNELERRVSAMLQTQFVLSRNYKLVDLKPAYGELFQEYLQGSDFWGYTDLDVLYGDLSRFFTDPILNSHDVLSPSDRLLVGHLTLIRNSPDLCRLYRECPNYLQILCQDSHEGFDEKGFHRLVMHLASVNKLRVFLRDMKQEDILLRLNGRSGFLVIWRRGRLYDVAAFREICHFHFMESKWKQMFNVESVRALDDCMILTPNSLVTVKNIPGKLRLLGLAVATIILAIPWYLRVTIRFPISRLRKSLSRMLRPLPYSQKPTDK